MSNDRFYNNSTTSNSYNNQTSHKNHINVANQILSGNLENDIEILKKVLDRCYDVVYRKFEIGGLKRAELIFVDGLVDISLINSDILKPLLIYEKNRTQTKNVQINEIQNFMINEVITASHIKLSANIQDIIEGILSGATSLLIDGEQQTILIDLKKFDKRNIDESTVEPTIRGPREAFTESLNTNSSLIRRLLKTPKLKMEGMKVGHLSKTDIVITYIDGIVKDSLVEEVRKRISRIDTAAVIGDGIIEELIEDNPFSTFSQIGVTEKPDRLASSLIEGRVGILIDNTPMVLIAPNIFVEMMKSGDDYNERFISASFITLIRYLFLVLSLLLPSFYIALLTFHHGMIPRTLLLTIASSREGVPFPIFIETLLMQIFFEGLQEASVRLPRVTGQTVSIVGGLVIGQAAVQAGIVSAATVIIVSITGIASFIIPRFNLKATIRMLRFFIILLASCLGVYGIFIGLIIILIHMVKLRSFGVPFLSPLSPLNLSDLKDTFIRAPWWAMISRPGFMETKNSKREKRNLRPHPPKDNK